MLTNNYTFLLLEKVGQNTLLEKVGQNTLLEKVGQNPTFLLLEK